MRKHSQEQLARDRARYAEKRLSELRRTCPDLPSDILDQTSLRAIAFAVRRASRRAVPYQTSLCSVGDLRTPAAPTPACDVKPVIAEQVGSIEENSG